MIHEIILRQRSRRGFLEAESSEIQLKRRLTLVSISLFLVCLGTIALCSSNGVPSVGELITESLLAVLLITTTYTDFHCRKIFNLTTYSTLMIGFVLAVFGTLQAAYDSTGPLGRMTEVVCYSFSVIAVGLMMLIPYRMSGSGAGDVKLAMAIAGLIGFAAAGWSIAIGYIVAFAAIALIFGANQLARVSWRGLARRRRPIVVPSGMHWSAVTDQCISRPIPLAGFFALGVLITRGWGLAE